MRFNLLLVAAGFATSAFAQSYNYARDADYYNAIEERDYYNSKVAQFVRSLDDDQIESLLRRDWKKKISSVVKLNSGKNKPKTPGGKDNIAKGAYDTLKHKVTKPKTNPVPHPKYDKSGKQTNDGRKLALE
ncbi:unnamed protein product [Clonostachys rosea]|uniref:Uncharacterized protein n=1 Tax=Bionectria ochroleuca TaxID=29856 RepID=A0ABY6U689_BIOOC|nr:unnamed protein product [Clonostachys rosea]